MSYITRDDLQKQLSRLYVYVGQLERQIVDTQSALTNMEGEKRKAIAEANALESLLETLIKDVPPSGSESS